MNAAKIRLSETEQDIVENAGLILTKNAILQKVNLFLGAIQIQQREHLQSMPTILSPSLLSCSPKISRGENYLGLPYQVLDYPRLFSGKNIIVIRTMFWWGNFFSVTLQVSGDALHRITDNVITHLQALQQQGFYFCTSNHAWEHHFGESNYQQLAGFESTTIRGTVNSNGFLKIAASTGLEKWDQAESILLGHFKLLVSCLAT